MTPADVHWSTLGAFGASMLAALVTVVATAINYLFCRAQLDPHVIVYAIGDERRQTIILLVIENIGKTMARDVTFSFSMPIPRDAYGFENAPEAPTMDRGPLITGIPALGPGAKRIITWGQYGGLYKALGDSTVDIVVRFTGRSLLFFPTKYEVVCPLDIKSFEYTDDSPSIGNKQIADQLKRIVEVLERKSISVKIDESSH